MEILNNVLPNLTQTHNQHALNQSHGARVSGEDGLSRRISPDFTITLHKFVPTIDLRDGRLWAAIANGWLVPRRGQWLLNKFGHRGQFIGVRNGVIYACWEKQGRNPYTGKKVESFEQRNQRFLRALWHHHHKSDDPIDAVMKAPDTVTLDQLKETFRENFMSAHG